ncbi:MAG: hypothetical protein KKD31_13135 [Bacteroidetes bacterium]|nr:hypothetical protein [Bacteroidota bacterium]
MKKILYLLAVLLGLNSYQQQKAFCQISSENGAYLPPKGTIRILIVFAEVVDAPYEWSGCWEPHQLPDENAIRDLIDLEYTSANNIHGRATKYFHDASFGQFIVLGDYWPELIQINKATNVSPGPFTAVRNEIAATPAALCVTKNGLSILGSDFDKITSSSFYTPKTFASDDYIDCIMILWRNNPLYGPGSGQVLTGNTSYPIHTMIGASSIGSFNDWDLGTLVFTHEFSHNLHGGNQFHTGGLGAGGTRYFIEKQGGCGLMASQMQASDRFTGWDRYRLGWKNPDHPVELIAAADAETFHGDLSDIEYFNTDLVYGAPFPDGTNEKEFILRDFITYGDAIRIELPYLKTFDAITPDQFLWVEYHNGIASYDYGNKNRPGLYPFIQIGKDDKESTIDNGNQRNYTYPLVAFGRYDFSYYEPEKIEISESSENPFTGYHFQVQPAFDMPPSPINLSPIGVLAKEWIKDPTAVKYNGYLLGDDFYNYVNEIGGVPEKGTSQDAFTLFNPDGFFEMSEISIGSNPPTTPVYTLTSDESSPIPLYNPVGYHDNRHIFLNGLQI